MWNKIRLIFPVIFAGIIGYHLYGHYSRPVRQPLPAKLADANSKEPHAAGYSEGIVDNPESEDSSDEAEEAEEPPKNNLPVVVLLSAVALSAGYFGFRRVWVPSRRRG